MTEVDARDFKRLRLDRDGVQLKLDFVADRVPRVGVPIRIGTASVDTVRNILSNKICAILGRDEGRDIADLMWISMKRRFFWPEVFVEAGRKEVFSMEDFLYRLSTFPLSALSDIPFASERRVDEYRAALAGMRKDIEAQRDNSLALDDAVDLG